MASTALIVALIVPDGIKAQKCKKKQISKSW